MTEAERPASWIDAILDCPEEGCNLLAYPYARIKGTPMYSCTCSAGHLTTTDGAALRSVERYL